VLGLTGGVVIATGLYSFLQRNEDDCRKIQLAVFHCVRILEDLPDLEERLQRPQELLKMVSEEVDYIIGVHLTRSERAAAISKVERKVQANLHARTQEEEAAKRRRIDSAVAEDEVEVLFDRPVEKYEDSAGNIPEVVVQSPTWIGERDGTTLQEQELPQEEGHLDLYMSMKIQLPNHPTLSLVAVKRPHLGVPIHHDRRSLAGVIMIKLTRTMTLTSLLLLGRTTHQYMKYPCRAPPVMTPVVTPTTHMRKFVLRKL
jgi:hypothetical protein